MADKSWLLNAAALKLAKVCIQEVQQELGVKLTLSHPDFLSLLTEYAELVDSQALREAYASLAELAGLESPESTAAVAPVIVAEPEPEPASSVNDAELVSFKGKQYAKYSDGLEFKGLYRGQAHYA